MASRKAPKPCDNCPFSFEELSDVHKRDLLLTAKGICRFCSNNEVESPAYMHKRPVAPIAPPAQATSTTDAQVRFFEAALALIQGMASASKRQRHDTDNTPRAYAIGVKKALGRLCVEVTGGDGVSFLTEAESKEASMRADMGERHLVAYMTPIFNERLMSSLPNDFVFVNSEEYSWIPQSSDLKINEIAPDHFVSPHYLVEFRPPCRNAPNNGQYGTFPVFGARRSLVAIGDAKKNLNSQGEGEFMKYLEAITYTSTASDGIVARGFVYDWEKCSLMTAINGTISQITTVKWVTPGSRDIFCNYFREYERDWHQSLQLACNGLDVTLPRFSSVGEHYGRCVLGTGASARVFVVMRGERRMAIKLVLDEECCRELRSEFAIISRLPDETWNIIVGVENDSLWTGTLARQNNDSIPVAAFLMSTVGIPFYHPSEVTEEYGTSILEKLSDLHAANIVHGDARYKNVVRLGGEDSLEFRWIDLRTCAITSPDKFESDVMTFFDSIYRIYDKNAVSDYANATFERTWTSTDERHSAVRRLWNYMVV